MQYLYLMNKLAMQGAILDDFLIDYVFTDIKDLEVNKTILYVASN